MTNMERIIIKATKTKTDRMATLAGIIVAILLWICAASYSLMGPLFLILITLKWLGKVTFSYWWITAPLWGPLAVFVSTLALTVAGVILYFLVPHLVRQAYGVLSSLKARVFGLGSDEKEDDAR